MSLKFMMPLAFLVVLVTGCGPLPDNITISFGEPTQDVSRIVQATFQAMTQQAGNGGQQNGTDNLPTNTPPGGLAGAIAGSLTYPADTLPAMAIIAYHVGGGPSDYYYVVTQQGQSAYQIDNLPAGVYHVVAYTIGGNGFPAGLAGGYTQATLCGYLVNCVDHTFIDVIVTAGSVTTNINPGDFYAPAGAFPAYPLP